MSMFFSRQSNSNENSRNRTIESLLGDFPWLWAISDHFMWSTAKQILVSCSPNILKLLLSNPPQGDSNEAMWVVTSRSSADDLFDLHVSKVVCRADEVRAEAIMRHVEVLEHILYVVLVQPETGSNMFRNITIFRHPERGCLNETVELAARKADHRVEWRLGIIDELI